MLKINALSSDLTMLGVFLVLLSACDSESEKERPSPLRKDSTEIAGISLKVTYSSPAVKNRKIWGGLEPYQRIWRIGANKATVFEVTDNVEISGNLVPKGKYSVFAFIDTTAWTIIFNEQWDQWGAYDYHPSQDLFRLQVTPFKLDSLHERLTFKFIDRELQFRWEYLGFDLPITLPASHQ